MSITRDDEDAEIAKLKGPRTATVTDVGQVFDKRITNVTAATQWFKQVEQVYQYHPLSYLTPVMKYAVDLHSKYMFPLERAFSEAFLAVPETEIAQAANEYLSRIHKGSMSGGDISTFVNRRKLREQNAANYGEHFRMVLIKFSIAVGATKTQELLNRVVKKTASVGGSRSLKDLLGNRANSQVIDDSLMDIVRPYYESSAAASKITYRTMKEMQRLIFRRLLKVTKGNMIVGDYNRVSLNNARRITDMFYMTMCFVVVSVWGHDAKNDNLSPESKRFIRMYQHTTAYVQYANYTGIMKLQYSFVDSEDMDVLTMAQPEYVQLFSLIGSNLCKHVNGKSVTARIQYIMHVIRNSTLMVTTAVLLATIIGTTQGGALVPVLSAVGVGNAVLIADIAIRIAKSHRVVVNVIRSIVLTHKYRVEKRDSSQFHTKVFTKKANP
jgi:hypothetical protein